MMVWQVLKIDLGFVFVLELIVLSFIYFKDYVQFDQFLQIYIQFECFVVCCVLYQLVYLDEVVQVDMEVICLQL